LPKKRFDLKKIESGVRQILGGLHVDLSDRNYKDTPTRVARMYQEMFTPRANSLTAFDEHHDNMVVLRGHRVFGMCPHHLLPVEMRVSLAYIPRGKVLGLSKLARAVEEHLVAPVLQEALTDLVARTLQDRLDPLGVAVVIVGRHGCMQYRGVRTTGDVITSAVTGVFRNVSGAREEFLRLIGSPE
jgi:GTP cyclohydrolase I